MDYDKLIEQLKRISNGLAEDEFPKCASVVKKAATALSITQAENEKLRAELEQVKREREKLERFLGELEGAVYTGQYFHLRPMIEKWRGQRED